MVGDNKSTALTFPFSTIQQVLKKRYWERQNRKQQEQFLFSESSELNRENTEYILTIMMQDSTQLETHDIKLLLQ